MTARLNVEEGDASEAHTVVLLGASNVRMGLHCATSLLRAAHPRLEAFVACGHGRSYGNWSSIPFRSLPGIVSCGLWDALARHVDRRSAGAPPLRGLITDVGNDLLYGASPPQILEWVEHCLRRLSRTPARLVITLPPFGRLVRLSRPRYYATRCVFFLPSRLTYDAMLDSVVALRMGLIDLARQYGGTTFDPPTDWYGFDPIHIRWTRRFWAWQEMFSKWPGFAAEHAARWDEARHDMNESQRLLEVVHRVKRMRPERRRFFFHDQFTPQPVIDQDGFVLSLY